MPGEECASAQRHEEGGCRGEDGDTVAVARADPVDDGAVDLLCAGGQSLITTTDLAHVPGGDEAGVARLAIAEGAVLREAA